MKAIYLLTRVFVDSDGNLIEGLEETLDIVTNQDIIRVAEDNHGDYTLHKAKRPTPAALARKGWEEYRRKSLRPTVRNMPAIQG